MNEVPYFYGNNGFDSLVGTLPPQAIPMHLKNKKWEEGCMNALENIGLQQLRENVKFNDYFKMMAGQLIYSDLVDLPPALKGLEDLMDEVDLPYSLKHFDLISLIVKAIIAVYKTSSDKFTITSDDDFAKNEYKRRKQDLINNYVREEIQKEIEIRLIEEGLTLDGTQFNSEEERQAYIQQIQQRRNEMAPADIDRHMTNYTNNFVRWANLTIDQDTEAFNLSHKDVENLEHLLLTGRCFRHYRIGWDFYEPENWDPRNTFFSQDVDTKDIQDSEYVGRVHFYTPSQVINKYGSQLSEKQIKKLINGNASLVSGYSEKNTSYKNLFESNLHGSVIAPHESYADYNYALEIQDLTGNPSGETTIIDKEGNSVKVPRYLPYRNSNSGYSPNLKLAQQLRNDLSIRTDLLQVTEAYWEGYKRVGELTYRIPETGRIEIAIVTEDLLEDFLRDNEIKKITSISLEEHAKKNLEDRVNTIIYTYVPVTYEGVKISLFNRDVSEDIYLKCTPMDMQLKGNSNVYNNKRPVAGIVDVSLANIIRPYQIGYNFAMNQVQNLSEKEMGIIFMFDMAMLPAEYRNLGDSVDEVLENLVNVARKTGFMPFDSNRQNTNSATGNVPFQAQNLTLVPQIQNCFERALLYKQAAFEQIGITPQMLGAPTKYETAEGVQVSQSASYAQIEKYLDVFSRFKKGALEMHLNVAQYSKKNNKDIRSFYTDSDNTTALLEFTDENFYARKLNVLPSSNSKKRKELETFKNYITSTNTLGDDTLALAEFITSDTVQEVLDIARQSISRRQQQQSEDHARTMEQIQAQAESTDQLNQRQWDRQETSKNKDRLVDIEVAQISKLGKSQNENFQNDLYKNTIQATTVLNKQQQTEAQQNLQQQEIDRKRGKDESESDYRERMLAIKEREVELRESKQQNDRTIALVNKN